MFTWFECSFYSFHAWVSLGSCWLPVPEPRRPVPPLHAPPDPASWASSPPMAACKTWMFCTFSFSLIDSIDVLSDMLEPKASSATQDRSEMGPLVFWPWLFFIFILILSRHYRIMWGRREGRRQEGARGQCSQKQKNKRTANWDLSPQAPSFQKVSAKSSIISQVLLAQGWPVQGRPAQAVTCQINPRATIVQTSCLPCLGPPTAFRGSTSHLLRRQKWMVDGALGESRRSPWAAAKGMVSCLANV